MLTHIYFVIVGVGVILQLFVALHAVLHDCLQAKASEE